MTVVARVGTTAARAPSALSASSRWPQRQLKLMMDRLVCADGGNPDPTTTHGKKPEEAKALELKGRPYPRHLADRLFGVVVHGDTEGADTLRRSLTDWLTDWLTDMDGVGNRRGDRSLHRLLRAIRLES